MKPQIQSHFQNNGLFIIKSLKPGDLDTAASLHSHLGSTIQNSPPVELREVASKAEVIEILSDIESRALAGLKPIVHFETHGNKDAGIYISASGEFLSWPEMAERFRAINVASGGNLLIVFAACFGFHAISAVKIFEPAPAYAIIGPDEKVTAGYIQDQIKLFYQTLFDKGDLVLAMEDIQQEFRQFHAENFFTETVIDYFRKGCMGKSAAARRERLISEVMSGIPNPSKYQLKLVRKMAKEFIKPNIHAFNRLSKKFIVDKKRYSMTFAQVVKIARGVAA